jgi:hypothetical protein
MQTFHINQILKVQMRHIYMCAKMTMGKQLVSFSTCGCESRAPFL